MGVEHTIFEGDGGGGLHFLGNGELILQSFTVRGARRYDEPDPFGDFLPGIGAGIAASVPLTVLDGLRLEDNGAGEGGALAVAADAELEIRNSVIVNNSAGRAGGGASLRHEGSVLRSENTDWSSGEEDNYPDDVAIIRRSSGEATQSHRFDGVATFECSYDLGECR